MGHPEQGGEAMKFTPRELFLALSAEIPTARQWEIIKAFRIACADKQRELDGRREAEQRFAERVA